MTDSLLAEIRTRGHWQVIVRPSTFTLNRILDIADLFPLVQHASVQLRGWDFPHVNPNSDRTIDVDWVGQETRWEHNLELWRVYRSGQFVHFSGFWDDWRDRSGWLPPEEGWAPRLRFGIGDAIFRFTEVFEFAARIAMTSAGDDAMHVEIRVKDLAGRALYVDSPNRLPLRERAVARVSEFPFSLDLSRTELVAKSRELALDGVAEVFKRFDWNPPRTSLKTWQSELGR